MDYYDSDIPPKVAYCKLSPYKINPNDKKG